MIIQRGPLWTLIIENSLLLVVGTAVGLAWANLDYPVYQRFSQALHFTVNDVGMVFFFALAVKEIVEATLPGGALASPREAAVPILAAAGGMVGPATLYVVLVLALGRAELMSGWAVPCATDIAFSYLAARFIFPRTHPAVPFLILLALFYPAAPVSLVTFAMLMIPALGVTLWLKRRHTKNFWPYIVLGGGLSWAALFFGGLHPALALVPILPIMPHAKRDLGLFDPREPGRSDTMNRFERAWKV